MPILVVSFKVDLYPAVRTTRKQKFVDRSYQLYSAAKSQIRAAVHNAMQSGQIGEMSGIPLRLALFINVPSNLHTRDLSNVLKGVEDGAQGAAYKNDAWIDQLAATRAIGGGENRAIMVLEPMAEGPARFSDWLKEAENIAMEWSIVI